MYFAQRSLFRSEKHEEESTRGGSIHLDLRCTKKQVPKGGAIHLGTASTVTAALSLLIHPPFLFLGRLLLNPGPLSTHPFTATAPHLIPSNSTANSLGSRRSRGLHLPYTSFPPLNFSRPGRHHHRTLSKVNVAGRTPVETLYRRSYLLRLRWSNA